MGIGSKRWDRLAPDERRALQEHRLRKILRTRVLPFSPFYRELFERARIDPDSIRTLDDLRRVPFTTKQDLLVTEENPDGPRRLILQPDEELLRERLPRPELARLLGKRLLVGRRRLKAALMREFNPCTMLFTTGRSTGSIPFFLTLYDHAILEEAARRICAVIGIRPETDRVLNLFPYAPHLAFWQTFFCGLASGTLCLNTGGGRVMGADRLLAAMERLRPTVVVGMPGYFYHLLRLAEDQGRDLSSVRVVALGGENVPAGFKRKVTEMSERVGARNLKVASVLGFTEARVCWAECTGERRTGFHTYPDLGLFEIIDPATGDVLPEGTTGELVYSCLDGRGSMVLRYRTGDIVDGGIVSDACPGCGRTVPRIMSDIRRVSNVKSLEISKVKGTLVNLNALAESFTEDAEIEEWQLEIRKRNEDPYETDELVLRCALRDGADPEGFTHRIQSLVHERSEVHLNAVLIEDLPTLLTRVGMEDRTKEERILDRRNAALVPGRAATP